VKTFSVRVSSKEEIRNVRGLVENKYMGAVIKQFNPYAIKRDSVNQNDPPSADIIELHTQIHEYWRWYGVKPEVRRLYELWVEIEAEDKAKPQWPRRYR
jgi:hypothetical protein